MHSFWLLVLLSSTLLCVVAGPLSLPTLRPHFPVPPSSRQVQHGLLPHAYHYETKWLKQVLDHFSFTTPEVTFQQRYLINKDHHVPGGPVFFYTGNEGNIEWFAANSGFVWEAAVEFHALIVFAEHRFYGQTLPFGPTLRPETLVHLTSEQALADFAVLVEHLKATLPDVRHSAFIAVGGSYGGMLAAWARIKFPHIFDGALAASAPILQFGDLVPPTAFNDIVTRDFTLPSESCSGSIRRSWSTLLEAARTETGRKEASAALGLCTPMTSDADVNAVVGWLYDGWTYEAMVDYPYPADFLQPLPAWPVRESCHYFSGTAEGIGLLREVHQAIGVFYNHTGEAPCFNVSSGHTSPDLDALAWDYQACTEMVMPMESNGVHDMFWASAWNATAYAEGCLRRWGTQARGSWAITNYGGRALHAASNIVFSNGELDPWRGGGVQESLSPSLIYVPIAEGAHHLDLRAAHPADPPSVVKARRIEKEAMRRWIQEAGVRQGIASEGVLQGQPIRPHREESV